MQIDISDFKPLTLEDRDQVRPLLKAFNPQTSELTFVNLYLWRRYYQFTWSIFGDMLVILASRDGHTYALPPVGTIPRLDVVKRVLVWMGEQYGADHPLIARADQKLVDEIGDNPDFVVTSTRDHFDYVYSSEDLGTLAGRKYSKKRNHINQFLRSYEYTYAEVTEDLVPGCLALAEVWCEQRLCEEDISLTHELCGIRDALDNLKTLEIQGGAIVIDGKIQAFALGEILNHNTAVVHIEKANPEYQGIYPMMTREFSANRWMGKLPYINREQDIGEPGLRRAKKSYYPDHMVKKYEIRLA
ncbi:MAG: phosphatidylglycerol lysyltransferase domain-containing protein [Anaerolineae bacterium]|nr:phosphatidylglycerol lysyltransferase domain-containing protein [Anaerolineae bacterium]